MDGRASTVELPEAAFWLDFGRPEPPSYREWDSKIRFGSVVLYKGSVVNDHVERSWGAVARIRRV